MFSLRKTLLTLVSIAYAKLGQVDGLPYDEFVNDTVGAAATGMQSAADAQGRYFGTFCDPASTYWNDAGFMVLVDNPADVGQLTVSNSLKWDSTEPSQNSFSYTNPDRLVAYAQEHAYIVRGHTLVWHSQLPSWVSGVAKSSVRAVMENHIANVAGRYAGKLYAWDVVNEPFNEDGSWRSDPFYNALGDSYVSIALDAARAADPDAKLYINDYNVETPGAKSSALVSLAKSLVSAGAPLQGIGFQGHFILGQTPSKATLVSQFKQYTDLGLEVAITELDIRIKQPASSASLAQQQTEFQNVVAACKALDLCVGVTAAGLSDKYSWVPNTFPGYGSPLMFDESFKQKPAYTGVVNGWGA
ncbi:glycoside hydrolase family 10 protein [Schizophyllum fasciatum]